MDVADCIPSLAEINILIIIFIHYITNTAMHILMGKLHKLSN